MWPFWSPRVGEKVLVRHGGYDDEETWTGFSSVLVVQAISRKGFTKWYGFYLPDDDPDNHRSCPVSLSWFTKKRIRRVKVLEAATPENTRSVAEKVR